MSVKKVFVPNASNFLFTGNFGLIAKYQEGFLKESSFPIPVIIIDELTKTEYPANLVSAFGFKDVIPELISRFWLGGVPSEQKTADLLQKYNVSDINQLGFYMYEYRS